MATTDEQYDADDESIIDDEEDYWPPPPQVYADDDDTTLKHLLLIPCSLTSHPPTICIGNAMTLERCDAAMMDVDAETFCGWEK